MCFFIECVIYRIGRKQLYIWLATVEPDKKTSKPGNLRSKLPVFCFFKAEITFLLVTLPHTRRKGKFSIGFDVKDHPMVLM